MTYKQEWCNERYFVIGVSVFDYVEHIVYQTINEAAALHLCHKLMLLEADRLALLELNKLAVQTKREENGTQ